MITKFYTSRGFSYYKFCDAYRAECTLQLSSAVAGDDGAYIWLGMDQDKDGNKAHTHIDKVSGHKIGSRMHLSQTQVKELLPLLAYFVKHGDFEPDFDELEKITKKISKLTK